MASVRRSDNHRSNAVRLDQRFGVRKDNGARRSRLRAGGIGVEDPREMRVGDPATEKARMFGTHHARSKDTHADAHLFAPIGFPRLNVFRAPSISSQWPSYRRRRVDRPARPRHFTGFIGASGAGITPAAAPHTDWSKLTIAPVMSPASSETRKFTARAASSGSMSRPKGSRLAAFSIQSGSPLSAAWSCRSLSEAIQPMLSWLTRMRLRITEKAVFDVNVVSAPLDAQ